MDDRAVGWVSLGPRDDFERRYVQRVLARHGGDIAQAAAASGIARRYFQLIRARQKGTPEGA